MVFITAYGDHDASQFGLDFSDEVSLTHQSMSADCDINNIMQRYEKTGVLEHVNNHQGDYGDFVSADDYHASMLKVIEAQDMFSSLPATIRSRFANDPAQFLDFVHNPDNRSEMASLGLLEDPVPLGTSDAEKPVVAVSGANGEAVRSET